MNANTIYCADACKLLAEAEPGQVNLVFADPPYNIGYVYDAYRDDRPDHEFVGWCREWMAACQRVLTPDGSMYIAIGDDFAADLRIVGRELGLHLRNWIIWHYTFGQNMRVKFCRSHTHILYFVKDPRRFTFNDHALRFPSARHTEYQDLRASPLGRLPNDVWDEFPRVCGTFRERAGFHGCQLPEAMLHRIVLASTHPGDIVMDPFVGSGTTVVAAARLGRKYIGVDLSPEYVKRAENRLRQALAQDARPAAPGRLPLLHRDLLVQIYRETKVTLENLLPNKVALDVIASALEGRCGQEYGADAIARELEHLASELLLPKLPNDSRFTPRNHAKSVAKRYVRQVQRYRGRRGSAGRGGDLRDAS